MRIEVRRDGKSHKVIVDGIQHGATLSSTELANKAAQEVQHKHYPHAQLFLLDPKRK